MEYETCEGEGVFVCVHDFTKCRPVIRKDMILGRFSMMDGSRMAHVGVGRRVCS